MASQVEKSRGAFFGLAVKNLGLITLGSTICAVAINGIIIPQGFLSGGFAGLALVIYYLVPALPLGVLYLLLNVPLFALGWKYVGRRFFWYSLAGVVIFSLALKWCTLVLPLEDKILSALLAGIIGGLGAGIILRSLGSAGGTDILSVILLQWFSVRLGTTSLAFNSIVLAAGAVLFSLEQALYTLVHIYVSAHMLNMVVTGLSQRKAAFIISSQWQQILGDIFAKLNRGVTIIEGRGGYTGQAENILYVVIAFREWPRLKEIVRQVDPKAFVVVTDTMEVIGYRIGNQPHW